PRAGRVAERCPLAQHLRQALEAFLLDHRPARQAAAIGPALALTPTASPVPVTPMDRGRRRSSQPVPRREAAARPPRHACWVAISAAVPPLRAPGTPLATGARPRRIRRPTVSAPSGQTRRPAPDGGRGRHPPGC